jgi:hypothetical protein
MSVSSTDRAPLLGRLKEVWRRITTGEIVRDGDRRLFFKGRDSFLYCEGDLSTPVQAELLRGPVSTVTYAGALKHGDAPHDHQEIPEPKRAEIAEMLKDFLVARGETVEIDWGSRPGKRSNLS